jgi:hypothetical protein
MRCTKTLQSERDRLERALNDLLRDMMKATDTTLAMMLDEASLRGQIKAIEYAMGEEAGGWPHDSWFAFIDARASAIKSLVKAGKSFPEVLETLNLTEIQARLIVKVAEPDTNQN